MPENMDREYYSGGGGVFYDEDMDFIYTLEPLKTSLEGPRGFRRVYWFRSWCDLVDGPCTMPLRDMKHDVYIGEI